MAHWFIQAKDTGSVAQLASLPHRNSTIPPSLLAQDRVLMHPFVVGELACGTPPGRRQTLASLQLLAPVKQASVQEVLLLLDQEGLFGQGLGLVDMSLLASIRLMPGARLWTLDRRLHAAAQRLRVGYLSARH